MSAFAGKAVVIEPKTDIGSLRSALPWCPQRVDATLYLGSKDGVLIDGTNSSSRFKLRSEGGVVGSLAARRIAEGDWACVWQAVIVDLLPRIAAWRDPAGRASALASGVDAVGTRGDIARDRGAALDPFDGPEAGACSVDGEPGDPAQWWPCALPGIARRCTGLG
jgi:hypothetical protein